MCIKISDIFKGAYQGLNFSSGMGKQVKKTYQGLNFSRGMGKQVKKTVSRRNDFRPQTSDSAPINGADKNDKIP